MTRPVRTILVVAAMWGASPGTALRAEEPSLAAELLAVYVERCKKEVKVLAEQLDTRHDEVAAELPEEEGASVLPAVHAAWARGGEVISLYRQLEDSPRKFTRWAGESSLPTWFAVPESVAQVRRWEAVRPILAPVAGGDRLDWHEPDAGAWAGRPGSWRYEHLLLLRWLSREIPGQPASVLEAARAWAAEQAGADFVDRWRQAAGEEHALFHGQYVYTLLASPPPARDLSPRLRTVIERLATVDEETSLVPFLREKDAFLVDLLAELLDTDVAHPTAVAWFEAGARAFPPLLAFEPEADGEGVRAVLARRDPTLERLLERLDQSASGVSATLSGAIFRSQARLEPGGKLDTPVAGWSTWIPSPMAAEIPRPDAGPSAGPLSSVGPAGVWSRICVWVLERLAAEGVDRPVRFTVENSSGWALAFRAEELTGLAKELGSPLRFASDDTEGAEGAVDVILAIPRVEPHRTITAELRIAGHTRHSADTTRFDVPGPWPPWFASRGFDPRSAWTWTALLAWGGLALRFRRQAWAVALLGVGLVGAVVILLNGPVPASSPELGGTLEFSLPLHEATPPAQREVIQAIVRGVYEKVVARLSDVSLRVWTPGWWGRFRHALRGVVDREAADAPAPRSPRLAEIEYRITRAAWPRRAAIRRGRVEATDGERFDAVLASLAWKGEPAPPRALVDGPDPGVRLVVSFWDGDHGALLPPADASPARPGPPVLSIVLPSPTRDGRPLRALDLGSRYLRIRERSTRTRSLVDGYPEALDHALASPGIDADASAAEPNDLEALRRRFWESAGRDPARLEAASAEIAWHALELITRVEEAKARGSRSVLHLPRSGPRRLAPWLVVLTAAAFWLAGPGLAPRGFRRLVIVGLTGLALRIGLLLTGLAALDATLAPGVWSYGGTSTAGMVAAFRILVVTLGAAGGLRLAAWVIEAWRGTEFFKVVINRAPEVTWRHAVPGWRQIITLGTFATAVLLWTASPVRDVEGSTWLPGSYGAVTMAGLLLWSVGTAFLIHSSSDRSLQNGSFSELSRRRSPV